MLDCYLLATPLIPKYKYFFKSVIQVKHIYLRLLPHSQIKYNSFFPKNQSILNLIKFIENITNIYGIKILLD
jgi:hypothetical protein